MLGDSKCNSGRSNTSVIAKGNNGNMFHLWSKHSLTFEGLGLWIISRKEASSTFYKCAFLLFAQLCTAVQYRPLPGVLNAHKNPTFHLLISITCTSIFMLGIDLRLRESAVQYISTLQQTHLNCLMVGDEVWFMSAFACFKDCAQSKAPQVWMSIILDTAFTSFDTNIAREE